MATLIFAQAKQIRKKVKDAHKLYDAVGNDTPRDVIGDSIINIQRAEFREILKIARLLHEDYEEAVGQKAVNWYFVTIRPRPGVTWTEFYQLVGKYVKRAFMLDYTLSFEQKSEDGTGEGFHVHIVCNTKHRSKYECLRDTVSTFNKVADANCIDVKPTRTPDNIVDNYLIAYESVDGHKAGTRDGDSIWRAQNNLLAIYHNDLEITECCLSSPKTTQKLGRPTVIQLD